MNEHIFDILKAIKTLSEEYDNSELPFSEVQKIALIDARKMLSDLIN